MKIIKFCKSYLLSQKGFLLLFISLSFLGSLVSTLSPYLLGDFIDHLVAGADEKDVFRFCVIFCAVIFFKIFKDYITSVLYAKMQVKMVYQLNMDVIKHLQSLSMSFFRNKEEEYLNQRINGDCHALITFSLTTLRDIISHSVLFLFPVIILFSLSATILAILVGFTFLYVIAYGLMKKSIYRSNLRYRESLARFYASLFEQIRHIFQIKINAVQPEFNQRTEGVFSDYQEKAIGSQRMNYIYSGLDGVIGALAQMVLFVVGGFLVIRGKFTVGMFTVFSSYFRMMLSSCRYFFNLAAAHQVTSVSLDRTEEILRCRPEANGTKVLQEIRTIEVKDLRFSYENSGTEGERQGRNVIDSFSHVFCRGNLYGIIGKNGTGKTTLTKLIVGLYGEERAGDIYYDNIPVEEIDMVRARKHLIGYAEQDPTLVEDSIYYNLTYRKSADEMIPCKNGLIAEEWNDLKFLSGLLNMEEFFRRNSLFDDTREKNAGFSGGEKQKIEILKVLYKNPNVMIFDEPTTALDQETKGKFLHHLTELKKDKIIFVVTHDNELISCCDEIVEM